MKVTNFWKHEILTTCGDNPQIYLILSCVPDSSLNTVFFSSFVWQCELDFYDCSFSHSFQGQRGTQTTLSQGVTVVLGHSYFWKPRSFLMPKEDKKTRLVYLSYTFFFFFFWLCKEWYNIIQYFWTCLMALMSNWRCQFISQVLLFVHSGVAP